MTQWLDTLSGTPAKHTAELPCSRQWRQFFLIFYLHIPGEEGGWRAGKRSEFSSLSPTRESLCKGGQISELHFCIPWDVSALLRFYSIKQDSDRGQLSLGHSERRGMGVFWGCRGCPWVWTETSWRQIGLTTQKAAACVSLTALTCHRVWLHSRAALDCLACPGSVQRARALKRGPWKQVEQDGLEQNLRPSNPKWSSVSGCRSLGYIKRIQTNNWARCRYS